MLRVEGEGALEVRSRVVGHGLPQLQPDLGVVVGVVGAQRGVEVAFGLLALLGAAVAFALLDGASGGGRRARVHNRLAIPHSAGVDRAANRRPLIDAAM